MIYPDNYESKIGFDTIRKMLKTRCLSPLGESRVDEMIFKHSFTVISTSLLQTAEFAFILKEEDFPAENFFDLRDAFKHIRIENTWFDAECLFELQRSLDSIDKIVRFLTNPNRQLPPNLKFNTSPLAELARDVPTFPHIVKRISQILDKYGNIKDSASPGLFNIRTTISNTVNSISHQLQTILKEAKSEGLVEKDASPTLRDGRLVIPVAPAMKRRLNGIVHDESDTGRTVFIEPAEVVRANNEIRELKAAERREIIRILIEFADFIRPDLKQMALSYEFLADIDFIRAKAIFANETGSVMPRLDHKQIIDWGNAVHPILQQSLAKTDRKVVPLDILLNHQQRILLISGPNAGGKSVCLKTVGLLQYMLQCGMLIPVAESSVCGIFGNIFIDIGDEQSLENDLSTYSSHLLNMKNMMKYANNTTLILIDEFGGGTEPQIGGAIAEAVLKRFNEKKAFGVITTHYQNLKHYAKDTPRIVNGAMLYDRQQMRPLFQLRIGNPGSSFAVEIARKIGIPEDVIADASELVGTEYINADKYLQDIVRDKRYWENKRQLIHQQEKKLEATIAEYEEKISTIKGQKREILEKARQDAENLLQKSNSLIEQTVKEIKEAQAEKEETKRIRAKLHQFREQVEKNSHDNEPTQPHGRKKRSNHKDTKKDNHSESSAQVPKSVEVGHFVRLKGQNTVGTVQKMNGDEVTVAFGDILTTVKINRLEPTFERPKSPLAGMESSIYNTTTAIRNKKIANFKSVADVRGMRGEECLRTITDFIDDAIVAGIKNVSILHGTGNGILRQLVRQYLATIPEVQSYRDELPQFGGTGITLVELAY